MLNDLIAFYRSQFPNLTLSALRVIVIADENFDDSELNIFEQFKNLTVITNRWDVYQTITPLNIDCQFNDFNFSAFDAEFDVCFYRISKERAVCHHVFNQARRFLKSKGTLCIGGKKSEGAKGYYKKITELYTPITSIEKSKDKYFYCFSNTVSLNDDLPIKNLDDKNYSYLREIKINDFRFLTKPGQYGWNKVDMGSKFLMDTLLANEDLKNQNDLPNDLKVLDLGCGYGYLSLRLLDQQKTNSPKLSLTATDNNAAAIEACSSNLKTDLENTTLNVIASDCARSIDDSFDLIVCNPPFHQGFENDRSLTHSFLESAGKHLRPSGNAYFVVNSFIPIEVLALDYFREANIIRKNNQFKLVKAAK